MGDSQTLPGGRLISLTHGPPVALGLRLWDPLYDRQADEGFTVTAQLDPGAVRPVAALRSGAGIYFFRSLPGPPDDSPRRVTFRVVDQRARFLPVTLSLTLPGPLPGVLEPEGPGLYRLRLFSSVLRTDLSAMAVVRTQLWDAGTDRPAARALLTVTAGGERHTGLTDDEGRLCLPFPYPVLRRPLLAEGAGPVPLHQHTWPAEVTVAYGRLVTPDLAAILGQAPGLIIADPDQDPPRPLPTRTIGLPFGTELLLRSGRHPALLVQPGTPAAPGDS